MYPFVIALPEDTFVVLLHVIGFVVFCVIVDVFWRKLHRTHLKSDQGRSEWIQSRLHQLRDRYSRPSEDAPITIAISTYNVASLVPKDTADLLPLCQLDVDPDLVVLGFQETEMSFSGLLGHSQNHACWERQLAILFEEIGFNLLVNHACGSSFLAVGVHPRLSSSVRETMVTDQKTGFGFFIGNKASVAARILIDGTSLCFVSSHLKDGQRLRDLNRRNSSFRRLCKLLTFDENCCSTTPISHDVCFWLGDLNYRLDLPRNEVVRLIDESSWDQLLEHADQLRRSQELPPHLGAFRHFREGRILFPPTYKLEVSSSSKALPPAAILMHNTYVSNRTPSYTDRILWRSAGNDSNGGNEGEGAVEVLRYDALRSETCLPSDHFPVVGVFRLPIRQISPLAYEDVLESVEAEYEALTHSGVANHHD